MLQSKHCYGCYLMAIATKRKKASVSVEESEGFAITPVRLSTDPMPFFRAVVSHLPASFRYIISKSSTTSNNDSGSGSDN